ncbi:hypothetical protein QTP88_025701 [Uroleucon formosanum]
MTATKHAFMRISLAIFTNTAQSLNNMTTTKLFYPSVQETHWQKNRIFRSIINAPFYDTNQTLRRVFQSILQKQSLNGYQNILEKKLFQPIPYNLYPQEIKNKLVTHLILFFTHLKPYECDIRSRFIEIKFFCQYVKTF